MKSENAAPRQDCVECPICAEPNPPEAIKCLACGYCLRCEG